MTLSVRIRHGFAGFLLDAAFEAPAGVTAIFGRSGAGKTTLVHAVAGLLRAESGRIALDGEVLQDSDAGIWLAPHRRRIGYVFQEPRLFPHLGVRGNLLFGARLAPGRAEPGAFDRIVSLLGLGGLLDRRPGALSGGEAARVAMGRALLARPRLLLMDEPLASLDAGRRAEILPYLERLRDEAGVPILYVSHAIAEVARLATTLVLIEAGRVRRAGPAGAVLADPQAVPILGLAEAGAVLLARIGARQQDGLTEVAISGGTLLLPGLTAAAGTALNLRVAARDVILSRDRPEGLSALNILAATVTEVAEAGGPEALVQLRCGGDFLLARITRRSARALGLAPGVACHAIVKAVAVSGGDG